MRKTIPVMTVLVLGLTGCATTTQGPLQRIEIESDPSGAVVTTERCGVGLGQKVTPTTIMVSRRAKRCEISISRDGYHVERVLLTRSISDRLGGNFNVMEVFGCDDCEGSFLDLVARATVGLAVAATGVMFDASSGAMYELQPSGFFVELEPLDELWDESWRESRTVDDGVPDYDDCPPH